MIRCSVGFALLLASVVTGVGRVGAEAPAVRDYQPPLRWAVFDDTLDAPLGAIFDAAVAPDRTVFLLDSQSFTIHRFSADGVPMAPIGRKGEGPGEFDQPLIMAVDKDGRCLVLQDFHRRAVCLDAGGQSCDAPDMAALQDGYMMTLYSKARFDHAGRLIVAGVFSLPGESTGNPEADMLFRVARFTSPSGGPALDLFGSNSTNVQTIALSWRFPSFLMNGWDVSPSGALLFADPSGGYRVTIGHPVDGASRNLDLPAPPSDDAAIARWKSENGNRNVSRVAALQWLDSQRFMVRPSATALSQPEDPLGVWEVFNTDGVSRGRFHIHCDVNAHNDLVFFRQHTLIVIKDGRAAVAASLNVPGLPADVPRMEVDEDLLLDRIEVRVYSLFDDVR